jgi:hypothetical protein
MVKETLTLIMKDKSRIINLKKINLSNWLRRVMGGLRKTLESGVSSTKSSGTT